LQEINNNKKYLLIPFLELKQKELIEKKDKIEMGKSTFTSMDIIQMEYTKGEYKRRLQQLSAVEDMMQGNG